MQAPLGFDHEKHDKYVSEGGCPFVQDKVYCNGRKGHSDRPHWALYHGPQKIVRVALHGAVVYERPAEPEISGGDARRGDSSYHGSSPQG